MLKWSDPENRRGLRNVMQAIALLVMLWFVYDIIQKLGSDVAGLREIARDVLIILALGVFLDKAENVTRAITFKAGPTGLDAEIGKDDTKADS